jgi:stage II sporulation protein AA (anti-sigma F factor antagonist)
MQVSLQQCSDVLRILLDGELDEHSSVAARQYIDGSLQKYPRVNKVVLDLSKVTFMDSTGIGFLIGRYKYFRRFNLPVYIANPNFGADKILSLGGIYALIPKL